MLEWFAQSPDPDAGLLAFRKISEGLGDTHWYLRKLRDEGEGAEQLSQVVGSSRYVTDLILRAPDSVALLGDDAELVPRDADRLDSEMELAARRHRKPDDAIRAVRRVRRRELSRVGIADVLGRLDIVEVGAALSDITSATLSSALVASTAAVEAERGELPTRMAIVLMGRLGGHESGYGSDADVMFVHEPRRGCRRGRRGQGGHRRGHRPPHDARRAVGRPAAGGRCGPATGRPQRSARAHVRCLPVVLREVLGRLGGAGAAARPAGGRRPRPVRPLHRADRPAALARRTA